MAHPPKWLIQAGAMALTGIPGLFLTFTKAAPLPQALGGLLVITAVCVVLVGVLGGTATLRFKWLKCGGAVAAAIAIFLLWMKYGPGTSPQKVQVVVYLDGTLAPRGTSVQFVEGESADSTQSTGGSDAKLNFTLPQKELSATTFQITFPGYAPTLRSSPLPESHDITLEFVSAELKPANSNQPTLRPRARPPYPEPGEVVEHRYATGPAPALRFPFVDLDPTADYGWVAEVGRLRAGKFSSAYARRLTLGQGLELIGPPTAPEFRLDCNSALDSNYPHGTYFVRVESADNELLHSQTTFAVPLVAPVEESTFERARGKERRPLAFGPQRGRLPVFDEVDFGSERVLLIAEDPEDGGHVWTMPSQRFTFAENFAVTGIFLAAGVEDQAAPLAFDLTIGSQNSGDKLSAIFGDGALDRGTLKVESDEVSRYSIDKLRLDGRTDHFFELRVGKAQRRGDRLFTEVAIYVSTSRPPEPGRGEGADAPNAVAFVPASALEGTALYVRIKKWNKGRIWLRNLEVTEDPSNEDRARLMAETARSVGSNAIADR